MIIREPTPPEALPDEFDPNNYCRQCNRIYTTTENYRQHLKRAHKMVLVRLSKRILDLNISPNPNDANNHCASCNRTYSSRRSYQLYLEGIHKKNCTKNSKAKRNSDISPDSGIIEYTFDCLGDLSTVFGRKSSRSWGYLDLAVYFD